MFPIIAVLIASLNLSLATIGVQAQTPNRVVTIGTGGPASNDGAPALYQRCRNIEKKGPLSDDDRSVLAMLHEHQDRIHAFREDMTTYSYAAPRSPDRGIRIATSFTGVMSCWEWDGRTRKVLFVDPTEAFVRKRDQRAIYQFVLWAINQATHGQLYVAGTQSSYDSNIGGSQNCLGHIEAQPIDAALGVTVERPDCALPKLSAVAQLFERLETVEIDGQHYASTPAGGNHEETLAIGEQACAQQAQCAGLQCSAHRCFLFDAHNIHRVPRSSNKRASFKQQ